jgi:hypothetical protein
MNSIKIFRQFCLLLLFACLSSVIVSAQTATFTYQGRLTDSATSQGNGSYTMKFRLYNAMENGDQIGSEQTALITVNDSVFTTTLDFPESAFSNGQPLWLEIQIGTTTLSPRQRITFVPFAARAKSAGTSDSLSNKCIGCVTNSQVESIDGAKVTGAVSNSTNAVLAADSLKLGGIPASSYLQTNGDGSQLTNLNASNITGGTISEDKLNLAGMGFIGRFSFGGGVGIRYAVPNGYTSGASGVESDFSMIMPNRTCQAKNFSVKLLLAPGDSQSHTFTLRSNGADTALSCTISGNNTNCNTGETSIVLPASALVSIKVNVNSAMGSSTLLGWECR